MSKPQIPHDSSYRRLFSHAVMVEDLIRRYVAPAWIDRLDFSTLEKVPARYVSEDLEQRESDVVWRLRYRPGGDWFYVYILIEFQSTVSRFMAIRVLVYMMLLYEDLIRRKQLTQARKLPPVVPIVLYNGKRPWTAPLQVADLIESLPGFEKHLPRFEIQLIDEGHLPREKLEPLDNPVTGVFQLEQSDGLEEIRSIIGILIGVLDDPEFRDLQQDLTIWVRRAILQARLPGEKIPELRDLQETKIMLSDRIIAWAERVKAEGREEGREEGWKDGQIAGALAAQRHALAEQIQEKFGALESRYADLIANASGDQLSRWLRAILTATTPGELFSHRV